MILDSTARLAPTRVADAVAFEVGVNAYTWDDVVLAATLWGEWQQVRSQVRSAMCALNDLRRRDAAPSDDEIESAADEFRYARDLITAEETESWLSRRGLDFDALLQFVERRLARRWTALRRDLRVDDYPTDDDVEVAVWSEAVCSGWLARLASRLATQAAVHDRLKHETSDQRNGDHAGSELQGAEATTAPAHTCPRHAETAGALGLCASPLQRLQWLRHLDECFKAHTGALLTPRALGDEIHLHQLDWVRVRVRYALFENEDTAREALLCVSQDRRPFEDAAERARVSWREDCLFLEEIDEEVRYQFLGAQPGDLLGPLWWAGRHGVFQLLEKQQVSEDDSTVCERAREIVLTCLLQDEVAHRVRWYEQF